MQHQNLQMLVYTRVLLKYIFYTVIAKQTVTLNLVRLRTHVYTAAHMRVVQLCTAVLNLVQSTCTHTGGRR